jgi:hypothetical protein
MSKTVPLAWEQTHSRPPANSTLSKNLMSLSYLGASFSQMRRTRSVSGATAGSPVRGDCTLHVRLQQLLKDDAGATVRNVDLVDRLTGPLQLKLPDL